VEITNNGQGRAVIRSGFDLTSLRNRVEAVGGRLDVHSEPPKGRSLSPSAKEHAMRVITIEDQEFYLHLLTDDLRGRDRCGRVRR
jgi:signal transduction histidine kinase